MKKRTRAVAAMLLSAMLFATCAHAAQNSSPDSSTARPAASAATPTQRYSVNQTPIEVLAADPQASKVVGKYLPDLFKHPAYESFKTSTLADLEPFSDGKITDDTLKSIQSGLDDIK